MKDTMTKEEALKKIEELKQYVAQEDEKKQGYVIKNRFTNSDIFISKHANVKDAVLEALSLGADLREADLRGADLSGADLSGAYLSGADLSGADLSGAYLREADLRGADLSGAELCDAKFYGRGGKSKLKHDQVADFLNALGFQVEQ